MDLDKRYRTEYHMSMIANLDSIKTDGIEDFLEKQEAKWRCPNCDGTICCHNGLCLNCNIDILRREKKYRWRDETVISDPRNLRESEFTRQLSKAGGVYHEN